MRYAVVIEKAGSSYSAYVPDLPGCITTGSTLEETERNIREAIEGHLKTMREFGDPIPRPTRAFRRDGFAARTTCCFMVGTTAPMRRGCPSFASGA